MAPTNDSDFDWHWDAAQRYRELAEWEAVGRELDTCLAICNTTSFPDTDSRRRKVLVEQCALERRYGRVKEAVKLLREALQNSHIMDLTRADILGELAVVQQLLGEFEEAAVSCRDQYELAGRLAKGAATSQDKIAAQAQACRAIGNLGYANYQIAIHGRKAIDQALLTKAIQQVEERISSANALLDPTLPHDVVSPWAAKARTWESIGYDRLTLLHAEAGNFEAAVEAGKQSQDLTRNSPDPTVRAFSRFFYGYALYRNQQRTEALLRWQYTAPGDLCTSAMSLCKEPSEERRGFLQILVDEGVQLDPFDEQGYSALDYAVFADDQLTIDIVVAGLQKSYGAMKASSMLQDSNLRKQYRIIFQNTFRPELSLNRPDRIVELRRKYAAVLDTNADASEAFDRFRYVHYSEFARHGRLPTPEEDITAKVLLPDHEMNATLAKEYVVFISYRWIGRETGGSGPDSGTHIQYQRMCHAMEGFLEHHPHIPRENTNLWVDCACISQTSDGDQKRGVSALPLIVAQCDAVISLVDERYYDRAWCAVELHITQTLRRSYHVHECWEHILHSPTDNRVEGSIRQSPVGNDLKGDEHVAKLQLSYQSDRPKIEFLVRQSRLLGKSQK